MFSFLALAISIATISIQPIQAINWRIIPCAKGFGDDNGCTSCSRNNSIAITSWDNATTVKNFHMESAASKSGAGYDVWWNIHQPVQGCRVLLFEPYNTDRGSVNQDLSGNVVLSVAHGGCYFSNVGSRGISAGACCHGDCLTAGAVMGGKKKRSRHSIRYPSTDAKARRAWSNPNPNSPPSAPPKEDPGITCSEPRADGFSYTKSGKQVVSGDTLNCGQSVSCSRSTSLSVSVGSTLTNEKSVTKSEGNTVSLNVETGFKMWPIGPEVSVSTGFSHDWSKTVTEGMSMTESKNVTDTLTLEFTLGGNIDYNGWFTPTLNCQSYKMKCTGDVELAVEKCEPALDGNNKPAGESGIMVIG
ncbi:hypothetical protein P280DRAFT_483421 [Massarina eburnea CBS 473.64]|uniref:Uncharacterized protein n=1 Tax=Massarina eburnea CBS 473.64 TaxID=1395130 RepID=A0A6A6RQF2_9PLEO|nr:hypothetical protein P280DRAFT_483421 [Massarina eburnea CBS 473.64]